MSQQQRTVLIVDDSPEDRELYRRYLLRDQQYSYTILEATLGQQGLELWQQHQPDVMLLDYRLPDLDGLEFLAKLHPPSQQPCLPVIVVSGRGNEAIAVQAIKAGAQDYLVKEQITTKGLQLAVNGAIATVELRKQADGALRESEERLRFALQGARQGIWDWDLKTQVLTWDERCKEIFGLPSEFPVTYEWHLEALHPEDRKQVSEGAAVALRDRTEFTQEYRTFRPDGTMRWILARGRGYYDMADEPYRMSGTVMDITDRKQTEMLLQEQNTHLNLLYQTTRDLLSTTEPLQLIDQLFHKLKDKLELDVYFNYMVDPNRQQIQLRSYGGISAVVASDIEWLDYGQAVCGTVAQQQCQMVESDIQHSYNPKTSLVRSLGIAAYSCQPLMSGGHLFGTLSFGSTSRNHFTPAETELMQSLCDQIAIALERSQLMKSLQQQNEQLQQDNRMKDEFLAILSHELRSPLSPILGWAKLLQTKKLDETKTAEALATIERNAKLQTQLIDDLLDIAKILRCKLTMNTALVNLVFVISSAIDTVRTAAIAKSILIHTVLPNIGQVSGDSTRLQQIVWNLLSNAIKFTPNDGRVEVRLSRVNNQAQIMVSDTGKGINPDFLPHIFESFRQEDISTTRKYGGLGLGLAIVRYLVEAHGGTVSAHSPGEGQGATFTVKLPLLNVEPQINQTDEFLEQQPDLTGIRVLIVDDEPDTRELLTELLTQSGGEVMTVASAAEALTALESFQPDVLVSDIGMPEVDGYTLLQQVRSLPPEKGGQIPAIALTAYADEADQQRAIFFGFQQHLAKPIEPNQLIQAILFSRGVGEYFKFDHTTPNYPLQPST